ncbi:glucose 1-dehydrogenase [Salipaludibacillus aurantiacus]|uniref:3alpha(Or 20beta)-hydroxysteroid dehydrogenase n=1 Tax=Salipaludibacillus aurantiacus TaxID=1601833 RepID=A0A1H9TY98_9BACI|nr:glucose 1-dehydrogenase [Salipaludibacillus aurantiacus]SES01887.1 3alpha(or 20beta)-hydroxysteroid dehydrogenase [Salipaludibacillus aurantiacus]
MGRLTGKVALITGGARGIGAAFAKEFVKEGAKVVITDVLTDEGEKIANDLGNPCVFFAHDVTSENEWNEIVKKTEETFGPVSVLVNNAGIVIQEPTESLSAENYEKVYKVNQFGVFLGMKSVLPSMKKAANGSIINISSISGLVGQAMSLAYNATKFAVRGMTKSAAVELGPEGIRVNSIHPGIIKTPMTAAEELQPVINELAKGIPLGRTAMPEELSGLCVFLASDESSYCTGSEFVADGGMTAG